MNEGHKFISLGYLVLPSLNKAFTYLLTYLHTVTRITFTKSPVLPWNNKEFHLPGYHVQDKSAIELTNFFEVPPADFHLPCCANTHSINFCSDS